MSAEAAVLSSTNSLLDETRESRVRDFIALLKPRVMSLVVFTAWCGLLLAPGDIHPFIAFIAVMAVALGSGAAGAINMWYDRDIDAIMQRTQKRPIPSNHISPNDALGFGVIVAISSVLIMGLAVNVMAASLLAVAILFYVFIYTMWLKRSTPQNIVIGGAAGAFPPMIGWATVTGTLSLEGVVLFSIIFMWTPPHFWALSLYRHGDYQKAGVPMLPVTSGNKVTRIHILVYSLLLIPTTLLPFIIGMSGIVYVIGASVLGVQFLRYAFSLYKCYEERIAKKLFGFSIVYLFLLFVLLVVDHLTFSFFSTI